MGEEAVEKHLKQIVDVLEMRMSEMGRALGVPESPLPEFKSTDPYLSAAEESLMRSYMTIENVLHHMTYITDAIHKLTGRIDGSQSIK